MADEQVYQVRYNFGKIGKHPIASCNIESASAEYVVQCCDSIGNLVDGAKCAIGGFAARDAFDKAISRPTSAAEMRDATRKMAAEHAAIATSTKYKEYTDRVRNAMRAGKFKVDVHVCVGTRFESVKTMFKEAMIRAGCTVTDVTTPCLTKRTITVSWEKDPELPVETAPAVADPVPVPIPDPVPVPVQADPSPAPIECTATTGLEDRIIEQARVRADLRIFELAHGKLANQLAGAIDSAIVRREDSVSVTLSMLMGDLIKFAFRIAELTGVMDLVIVHEPVCGGKSTYTATWKTRKDPIAEPDEPVPAPVEPTIAPVEPTPAPAESSVAPTEEDVLTFKAAEPMNRVGRMPCTGDWNVFLVNASKGRDIECELSTLRDVVYKIINRVHIAIARERRAVVLLYDEFIPFTCLLVECISFIERFTKTVGLSLHITGHKTEITARWTGLKKDDEPESSALVVAPAEPIPATVPASPKPTDDECIAAALGVLGVIRERVELLARQAHSGYIIGYGNKHSEVAVTKGLMLLQDQLESKYQCKITVGMSDTADGLKFKTEMRFYPKQ